MASTDRLRAAIVGAGVMGRWHADASTRAGGRVVAVVDPDLRRAETLARRHRGCRPFESLAAALDLADVVHICTPTNSHAPLATEALSAGRHVLLEKPLATTAEAVDALLALGRSRSRLICPVHQFLFQDGTRAALDALRAIGPLHHVDVRMVSAGGADADPVVRDRIAYEILPHPFALLARLAPDSLDLFEWTVRHPEAGEIRALGQSSGVTAAIVISMGGRPNVNRVELIARRATLHIDWFGGFAVAYSGTVSGTGKLARPFTIAAKTVAAASANLVRRTLRWELAYPGLRPLVVSFYDAVRGRAVAPISEAEMLAVARAGDRFRAALERVSRPDANWLSGAHRV